MRRWIPKSARIIVCVALLAGTVPTFAADAPHASVPAGCAAAIAVAYADLRQRVATYSEAPRLTADEIIRGHFDTVSCQEDNGNRFWVSFSPPPPLSTGGGMSYELDHKLSILRVVPGR